MQASFQPWHAGFFRKAIAVVAVLTCIRVWSGPLPVTASARAQLPDSARQRLELIAAVEQTNRLLGEIKQILTDTTLNVQIRGADNTSADNQGPRRSPQAAPTP